MISRRSLHTILDNKESLMSPESLLSNPVILWAGAVLLGAGIASARKASIYAFDTIFDAGGYLGIIGGMAGSAIGAVIYLMTAPTGKDGLYIGTYFLIGLIVSVVTYGITELLIAQVEKDKGGFPYALKNSSHGVSNGATFGLPSQGSSDDAILSFAESRAEELDDILPDDGIWDNCREHIENLTETVLPKLLETREQLKEDIEYANQIVSSAATTSDAVESIRKSAQQRTALITMFNDVERRIADCLSFLGHANLDIRIAIRSGETAVEDLEQRLLGISEEITVNVEIQNTVREEMTRIANS